jgi:hypothetical protein
MILLARKPCEAGQAADYDGFLPPFRCTACGGDCDRTEWQCRGCTDWLCSAKCMAEHLRVSKMLERCDGSLLPS